MPCVNRLYPYRSDALRRLRTLCRSAAWAVALLAASTPLQGQNLGDWSASAVVRGGIAGGVLGLGVAEVRAVLFDDRVQGDLGPSTFLPVIIPAGVGAIGGLFLERRYGPTVDQGGDLLLGAGVGAGVGALTGFIRAAAGDEDPLDGFWSGMVVGTFVGAAGAVLLNRTRHVTDPGVRTDTGWVALGAGIPVLITIGVGF